MDCFLDQSISAPSNDFHRAPEYLSDASSASLSFTRWYVFHTPRDFKWASLVFQTTSQGPRLSDSRFVIVMHVNVIAREDFRPASLRRPNIALWRWASRALGTCKDRYRLPPRGCSPPPTRSRHIPPCQAL